MVLNKFVEKKKNVCWVQFSQRMHGNLDVNDFFMPIDQEYLDSLFIGVVCQQKAEIREDKKPVKGLCVSIRSLKMPQKEQQLISNHQSESMKFVLLQVTVQDTKQNAKIPDHKSDIIFTLKGALEKEAGESI